MPGNYGLSCRCYVIRKKNETPFGNQKRHAFGSVPSLKEISLRELIDKCITIYNNSKTVFTDYEILKLVFHSPQLFSVFCQ